MKDLMKISLVIPVYNEAECLGACLEAITGQTVAPYEVIVVDNNSTDNTAVIAQNYGFVTLLREKRQGVVHARNRGFDTAGGDIIGRIDADTLLPPDWVAQMQNIFQDISVSAVSGAPHYYDFALAGLADAIDLYLRLRLARNLKDTNFLWGANMAVRRSAWQQARPLLCSHRSLHEDFDLAIHLQALGQQVVYDESLVAGVSSRRIDTGFIDYVRYTLASPRTYAAHHLRSRYHMYPVLMACWLGYLPGRLIYRGCDPATGSFSLSQLLAAGSSRVDPTANVA
jgi:cellulose synthase/poly-beta-1,6-N-acetylglucosamine synthase-like glycosyltransferase